MTVAAPDPRREPQARRITVVQGSQAVGHGPDTVLSTLLGSCVCACLWDAQAGVGGMNHFLLPEPAAGGPGADLRYGVHAMELLVNALFAAGARRARLQAKLFGGARLTEGVSEVGRRNSEFAVEFLKREGVPCLGASLGGELARRVEFWPATGRVRQRMLHDVAVFRAERGRPLRPAASQGAVQLF